MKTPNYKRLFKVAAELNEPTQSIVDTLNNNGFDAKNSPYFKISVEMQKFLKNTYSSKIDEYQEAERKNESEKPNRNVDQNKLSANKKKLGSIKINKRELK